MMKTSQRALADPDLTKMMRFKADLIWEIRKALHDRGAIELPMPILQRTREGAPVNQWASQDPASGRRWYLRHSMEDHLRMASAAHGNVFEIGKAIRADGGSPTHAHEFVLLEMVFREMDYETGVNLVRDLLSDVVAPVAERHYRRGSLFQSVRIRRWDEVFEDTTHIDRAKPEWLDAARSWLASRGVVPKKPYRLPWEILEDVMKHAIEPACIEPTILTHFPNELQHVCIIQPQADRALRMSAVCRGVEVSDGGVKFAESAHYRQIYQSNAEYRRDELQLDGNDLPEEFFGEIDAAAVHAFTAGLGIDRLISLASGIDIRRTLIFPDG